MEKDRELIEIDFDSHRRVLTKWLRVLLIARLLGLINILLIPIQLPLRIIGWISDAVSVVAIVSLFSLRCVHRRYKKAAILRLVSLAGGIISELSGIAFVSSAVSVCSVIAAYQEYTGHMELVEKKDPALSGKWHSLFLLEIGVGLFAGLLTVGGAVMGIAAGGDADTVTTVVLIIAAALTAITEILYLRCLKKTMGYFRD